MTLLKRKTYAPQFPQIFDDFFSTDFLDWGYRNNSITNTTLPSVNIIESDDGFTVEMAVPGMNKKDFHIELDNETLTISSEKELTNELKDNQQYTKKEYSYQSFTRSFHLPKTVVEDSKIKAKYENGILKIMIPKKEEAKALPARQILVN